MSRWSETRAGLLKPAARFARAFGAVKRFARDTGGGVMIWTGIGMPVLLGVSGLGLDSALWYLERRVMQSAADTAAISAALAKAGGGDTTAINAAVTKALADNKFTIVASDVLSVNIPPTSGPNTGNASAVEIVIRRKANMFLSRLINTNAVNIRTRAVAGAVVVGKHCIVALDETADAAVLFTGTADANIGCGVASNSKSDKAIHISGKAVLQADPAQGRARRGCPTRSVPTAATCRCRSPAPARRRPTSAARRLRSTSRRAITVAIGWSRTRP
jgi:Flp pilus assembly protein TadG